MKRIFASALTALGVFGSVAVAQDRALTRESADAYLAAVAAVGSDKEQRRALDVSAEHARTSRELRRVAR